MEKEKEEDGFLTKYHKKNERKKQGHRQPFTAVKILEIGKPKKAKAESAEVAEGGQE